MKKRYWFLCEERCLGYRSEELKPCEYFTNKEPDSLQEAAALGLKLNQQFMEQGTKKNILQVNEYLDHETHEEFVDSVTI